MFILDTAGDTIQAEASAASSITVSCYGIETASGVETFKKLGQDQLTGSGTQDTLYTVPASTLTMCSVVVIANTSGSARTIKLWHVPNGDSPGDANAILGTVDIAANSTIMWNKGHIIVIPASSGAADAFTVKVDAGAAAGYIGAASNDGVLRISAPILYADGGDYVTLSLDAGLTDLAGVGMAANKFYYTSADNTHVAGTVTAFARTILDDVDEATFKATVNLEIGTDVLAQQTIGIADDNLVEIDDADAASTDYCRLTANGIQGRDATEVKTDLGLVIGTNVQAYDAELTSLAALSYVAASFVKMTGANTFALRTIGETADDLEATIDHDNLANGGAHDYAYISGNDGATGITAAELEELSDGSATTLHSHAGAAAFGRPIILTPQCNCGPATNFATLDTIAGGSTPAETVAVLDFDPDASEYADFKFALPADYAGGGLTITVVFSMTSDHDEGTPHKVRWEIGFARIDNDGIAISGDHAYAYNGVSAIVPSVVSEVSYDDITFTDGADMDSLAAGEMAILRIYRDHDHADDNATGDAELQIILIKET